jgi:hypothetical protein
MAKAAVLVALCLFGTVSAFVPAHKSVRTPTGASPPPICSAARLKKKQPAPQKCFPPSPRAASLLVRLYSTPLTFP